MVVAQLCYTQAQYQFNEEYIRNYQNNARNLGTYIGENLDLEQLELELDADASRGRLDLLSLGLLGGLLGGLFISFLGVFFSTSPLLSLIYMTSHG